MKAASQRIPSDTTGRARPADVLLDMLRGARHRGRSAAYLVETGELFGFTANTVRVTLSRLQARGLIESPSRGRYCLTADADPVNDFVERWRLGEHRVHDWDGERWVFAHAVTLAPRSAWALDTLGFRCIEPGIHARPDNLSMTLDELRKQSYQLGLTEKMLVIVGAAPFANVSEWHDCWQPRSLEQGYVEMTNGLRASARKLASLPLADARLESFRLGGAGIRMLAKDPLLPDTMVDVKAREQLWRTLTEYDLTGQAFWSVDRNAPGSNTLEGAMPVPGLAHSG